MCFEVSEKTILPQWWEGFQFFTIGDSSIPTRENLAISTEFHGTHGRLLRSSHRKFGRIRTKIWSPGENVGLKACLEAVRQRPGSLGRRQKPFLPESPVEWRFLGKSLEYTWKLQPSSHNLWGCISNYIVSFHFRVVFHWTMIMGEFVGLRFVTAELGFLSIFPPKATESIEPTESSTMNFPSSLRQYTPSILKDFFVKSTRAMWTFWF